MITTNPQAHIRFDGRSFDVPLSELDIGVLSSDDQIRRAIADFLQVPAAKLNAFAVEKNEETGEVMLRPEAIFG